MIHTRYRIPRATKAALLLGGAACGGSSGDGGEAGKTEGINISDSRIKAVAKAYCEQYQACNPEYFDEYYDSMSDCIAIKADEFEPPAVDKECVDAFLDYVSCYSKLSCDELDAEDEKCRDLSAAYAEKCGDYDDDDYARIMSGGPVKRLGAARTLVRKYRIPR